MKINPLENLTHEILWPQKFQRLRYNRHLVDVTWALVCMEVLSCICLSLANGIGIFWITPMSKRVMLGFCSCFGSVGKFHHCATPPFFLLNMSNCSSTHRGCLWSLVKNMHRSYKSPLSFHFEIACLSRTKFFFSGFQHVICSSDFVATSNHPMTDIIQSDILR